ncbi:MAG: glutaredoxin family protein [Burkholderiales bacterium]
MSDVGRGRRRHLLPPAPPPEGGHGTSRHGGAARPRRWTMLVRSWCHLCDEMRDALKPMLDARHVECVEIDVDADPVLDARFGERVPVLIDGDAADGREICHLALDRAKVRAALAAITEIR